MKIVELVDMEVEEYKKHDLHENCTKLHGLLRSGWMAKYLVN